MTLPGRLSIRLSAELLKRLDEYRACIAKSTGLRVTLADAARQLIARVLDTQKKFR